MHASILLSAWLAGFVPPSAVDEPSPIPESLMAEAKKAFARKMNYFIWTEEKTAKSTEFQFNFAVNPNMKEEPASTVARFYYTQNEFISPKDGTKQNQRARVTSAGEGITGRISNEGGHIKGAEDVTYHLVKASDANRVDWSNPTAAKPAPISNALLVKVTFEAGSGPTMLQMKVAEVGESEPSPIPDRLMAEAKKTFAKKMVYFLWSDEKVAKAQTFQLKFAVNPELNEEPAFTVAKFVYTTPPDFGTKKTKNVPMTSTYEGIKGRISNVYGDKFKGTGSVTYFLIKASDAGTRDRPNLNAERATPISNTFTVKVTFE